MDKIHRLNSFDVEVQDGEPDHVYLALLSDPDEGRFQAVSIYLTPTQARELSDQLFQWSYLAEPVPQTDVKFPRFAIKR